MNRNPFAPATNSSTNSTAYNSRQQRGGFEHRGQLPHNQPHHAMRNPFAAGSGPQHQDVFLSHKQQQSSSVDAGTGRRNDFRTSPEGNGGGGRGNAGGKYNVTSDFQQRGPRPQYQLDPLATQHQRHSPNIPQNQQYVNRNPFVGGGRRTAEGSNMIDTGSRSINRFTHGNSVGAVARHLVVNNDFQCNMLHTIPPVSSMNKNPFARTDVVYENHQVGIVTQPQPQHIQTNVQNNILLKHIDASVAISGELKTDIEFNFDFADAVTSGGQCAQSTTIAAADNAVSELSGTSTNLPFQDMAGILNMSQKSFMTSCSSPFDILPDIPPANNPYGTPGARNDITFCAGFVPTVAPPSRYP